MFTSKITGRGAPGRGVFTWWRLITVALRCGFSTRFWVLAQRRSARPRFTAWSRGGSRAPTRPTWATRRGADHRLGGCLGDHMVGVPRTTISATWRLCCGHSRAGRHTGLHHWTPADGLTCSANQQPHTLRRCGSCTHSHRAALPRHPRRGVGRARARAARYCRSNNDCSSLTAARASTAGGCYRMPLRSGRARIGSIPLGIGNFT